MAKRRPAETQQMLLDAALGEFAENGLAGARIDRIAAAAGISKPMLYVHFGDKEALFDAVLSREILAAAQDERFDADDLPGYAGRTYDLLTERPHLWRLMTWFHLERGQEVLLLPPVTAYWKPNMRPSPLPRRKDASQRISRLMRSCDW